MALPDYTTQDAATYKANIDSTAADHDSKVNPEIGSPVSVSGSNPIILTGIAAKAPKKIELFLEDLSVAATFTSMAAYLGTSSTFISSANGWYTYFNVTPTISTGPPSEIQIVSNGLADINLVGGIITLRNLSGNDWYFLSYCQTGGDVTISHGKIQVGGALDRIMLKGVGNGSATYDGGTVIPVYHKSL